jgi:isopentenyldiphosphate isomerase
MEYKKITIVDENDTVLGYENYFVAVEKGLIRRASVVFIFDTEGNMLVQKRSAHISKPLLFDKSVGGHVDEGETYHNAAIREMSEELGLVGVPLEEIVTSFRSDSFFDAVYKAVIPRDTVFTIDPHEVDSVKWMSAQELDVSMQLQPELYTNHFVSTWQQLHDKLTA